LAYKQNKNNYSVVKLQKKRWAGYIFFMQNVGFINNSDVFAAAQVAQLSVL